MKRVIYDIKYRAHHDLSVLILDRYARRLEQDIWYLIGRRNMLHLQRRVRDQINGHLNEKR